MEFFRPRENSVDSQNGYVQPTSIDHELASTLLSSIEDDLEFAEYSSTLQSGALDTNVKDSIAVSSTDYYEKTRFETPLDSFSGSFGDFTELADSPAQCKSSECKEDDDNYLRYMVLEAIRAGNVKIDPQNLEQVRESIQTLCVIMGMGSSPAVDLVGAIPTREFAYRDNHTKIRQTRDAYLSRFKRNFQTFIAKMDSFYDCQGYLLMLYESSVIDAHNEYSKFSIEKKLNNNRCREYRQHILRNFNIEANFGFDASYCIRAGPWSDVEVVGIVIQLKALLDFESRIPNELDEIKKAVRGAMFTLTSIGLQDPYAEKLV
jgi:hypothetical protein